MIINQLTKKQKIISILLILIFITIFVLLFLFQSGNKYGDEINISGFDKYISNMPADRKSAINSSLYNIIESNLKSNKFDIKDAIIRESSVKDNYNNSTNINSGSFIVDIPSIKHSYLISYEWSSDSNNINMSGYGAIASCLPINELIYDDFNCKDDFNQYKTQADPILNYLPYEKPNYIITADINNSRTILNINLTLYGYDTRDNTEEEAINKYKTEIINWIKSINLNPDNYSLNYIIN